MKQRRSLTIQSGIAERQRYEMAKDEAIRNQKVFVRLDNVLDLQRRFQRAKEGYEKADSDVAKAAWKARKEAFEEVIAVLQLPMNY